MVEANTILGHYIYHYRWVTKRGSDGSSVTYEVLQDKITLARWERLESSLKHLYELKNITEDDLNLARTAVYEAAEGFQHQAVWLRWLIDQYGGENGDYGFVSGAMVPENLKQYFLEAQSKYGIPWWFLAALCFVESSFDPNKVNGIGAFGLGQFLPATWNQEAPRAGFSPAEMYMWDPRAQVLTAAQYLWDLGLKNVNWDATGTWRRASLPVLAFYGGYGYDTESASGYAEKIWTIAEQFQNARAVWPVPGCSIITSPFGYRDLGGREFHHGIDIGCPVGTRVVSASAGIVDHVGWENPNNHEQGYGYWIRIKDGSHAYIYGHLQPGTATVKVGDHVQPGQPISQSGNTGRSTGPHLHFGVLDLRTERYIDPLTVVQP
ncbi:M23 family metallopeptidase [Desulfofundulus thermocisternus]|uniref:M23 family metallopeptidase n=1 Tax=Desulfofundulus thermocisternus TaxID=42471 RepID=UPI002877CA48|nr:M23 family metallopeptidase [Desulfofundulus thermocisternus]